MAEKEKKKTETNKKKKTHWVETKSKVEYFCKGIHLQSKDWVCQEDFRKDNEYKYIPDSGVYGDEHSVALEKSRFRVRTLIHATTPNAAADILVNGFKPNQKYLGLQFPDGMNKLIWWGISPDKSDIEKYSKQCEEFTQDVLKKEHDIELPDGEDEIEDNGQSADTEEYNCEDSLVGALSALKIEEQHLRKKEQERKRKLRRKHRQWKEELNENFCSSPPFCITSRYGNIIFEYDIDQVLRAYSSQYCKNRDPAFLVLGTFAYLQEVMHTIFVCPPNTTEVTSILQLMDENNSVIYKTQDDRWIWRPETTGSNKHYYCTNFRNIELGKYRRWEHATFAFLIPDGQNEVFMLNNQDMHTTYCPPSNLFRLHTNDREDRKEWTINETLHFFHDKHILNTNFFLGIIHKFLVQNWKKENKQYEGFEAFSYMRLKTAYMERLLDGTPENDQSEGYHPDELLEMVKDPAKCTERWQLWIRQMAHYLLTD